MKKIMATILAIMLIVLAVPTTKVQASTYEDDLRGVWISTVFNIDYPSTKNSMRSQKQEFIDKLDKLQAIGINSVFVQVRPKADALYTSLINPWSDVLTGVQGKSPGYDPLAFMVEEAHKRNMEIHAWLNPYRVTTSGTNTSVLSETSPARLHPDWVFSYNNALYYNPKKEGVKQHIVDTVKEIITYYDVDGIHFDDYFYPSNYPLPPGQGRDGEEANNRRASVNDMVKRVGETIREYNKTSGKDIQFGISPAGIWKNSKSDPTGSKTNGGEAYYSIYCDARTWIQNGYVDYIMPQIYWKIGHDKADYETLVKWWSNEVKGTNVKLYIGQGIYSDPVAPQIGKQLAINDKYSEVSGSVYFSCKDLLGNKSGCADQIKTYYTNKGAAVPSPKPTVTPTASAKPSVAPSTTPLPSIVPTISPLPTTVPTTSDNVEKIGASTTDDLNVRSGASTSYGIIGKLNKGDKVTILDTSNGWYNVRLANNVEGWVSSSYITLQVSDDANTSISQGIEASFKIGSREYKVNGTSKTMDATPYIQNGYTMIPIRYVADALGIESKDIKANRGVITINAGGKTLTLTNNSTKVTVNDKVINMATKVIIKNGRTYVPVGEIGRLLDVKVSWNNNTKTATFKS